VLPNPFNHQFEVNGTFSLYNSSDELSDASGTLLAEVQISVDVRGYSLTQPLIQKRFWCQHVSQATTNSHGTLVISHHASEVEADCSGASRSCQTRGLGVGVSWGFCNVFLEDVPPVAVGCRTGPSNACAFGENAGLQ
jgi:hypothetical protein